MATPHIPYREPLYPLDLQVPLELLRAELAQRIHSQDNARSTGAFMSTGLCYFEPAVLYQVAVKLAPDLDCGTDLELIMERRRVIKGVVDRLKKEGAIEEDLLRSADHYCGKFRLCLEHGCADPTFLDVWLVPVRPEFFWQESYPGVPSATRLVDRRRLTGLAALRSVTPRGQQGRARI